MTQAPTPDPDALAGMRVLVVEDSFLVAASIKSMLSELGCTVIGPAPSVREAMRIVNEGGCDAAILDINLGHGETAEPVARILEAKQVPFFFVTGYTSPRLLSDDYRTRPRLMKPIDRRVLRAAMLREFRKPPSTSSN